MRCLRRLLSRLPLFVALVSLVAGVSWAEPPACEGLCWTAPPSCPTQTDVLRRIEKLAQRPLAVTGPGWVATVTHEAATWRLELVRGAQRRSIEAPQCATLADAAAVAIVLSEPPEAAPSAGAQPAPKPEETVQIAPAQPAASASGPTGTWGSGDSVSLDGEAAALTPPPPPSRAPTLEELAGLESFGGARAGAAPTPSGAAPQPAVPSGPKLPPPQATPPPPLDADPADVAKAAAEPVPWQLTADGLWDGSLMPESTFGAALGLGYHWGPQQGVLLRAILLQPRRVPFAALSGDELAEYSYAAAALSTCWRSLTRLHVSACGGLELGRLRVSAPSLSRGQPQRSVFPSATASLAAGATASRAELSVGPEAIVPLLRDRFTANQGGLLVHAAPRLSVRFVLRAAWAF